MTTGLWRAAGVPKKGWSLVGVHDLGHGEENHQLCQMCAERSIRYVHTMRHPEYPVEVEAGCHCAERMADNYVGGRLERELVNRAKRRSKWLTRTWRTTRNGNQRLTLEGYVFIVAQKPWGWSASLMKPGTDQFIHGKRSFPTENEAKLALFDHVWPPRISP